MSRVYAVEVRVYATAYIVAADEADAMKQARALAELGIEVEPGPIGNGLEVSGAQLDTLEGVTLSPAMTIKGPDEDETPELVHDDEEAAEFQDWGPKDGPTGRERLDAMAKAIRGHPFVSKLAGGGGVP